MIFCFVARCVLPVYASVSCSLHKLWVIDLIDKLCVRCAICEFKNSNVPVFKFKNKILIRSLWLFLIGIILFSFSIYILSIQTILEINLNILGPVTPIGGLILISAWINLLFSIRKKNDN